MTIDKASNIITGILLTLIMIILALIVYVMIVTTPKLSRLEMLEQRVDTLEQAIYD